MVLYSLALKFKAGNGSYLHAILKIIKNIFEFFFTNLQSRVYYQHFKDNLL